MKSFVVNKYHRSVVLGSLAASLLMGAISAPAWAASTDAIANNSPSASTTSGQSPIMLGGIHLQLGNLFTDPKVRDLVMQHLKDHQKIKINLGFNNGKAIVSGISDIPTNAQNLSTPVETPYTPSVLPANAQNQSNASGSMQYTNPTTTSYGASYTPKIYVRPRSTSTVYVLIY